MTLQHTKLKTVQFKSVEQCLLENTNRGNIHKLERYKISPIVDTHPAPA